MQENQSRYELVDQLTGHHRPLMADNLPDAISEAYMERTWSNVHLVDNESMYVVCSFHVS